jgi:hypothetical protein
MFISLSLVGYLDILRSRAYSRLVEPPKALAVGTDGRISAASALPDDRVDYDSSCITDPA